MGLLTIFKKPPPIRAAEELAAFIDENAAFVTQKGIFEYSRARAGHYAKVLFSEQTFVDALERSRWCAFPLGLAMVGELVEALLRPETTSGHSGEQPALRDAVCGLVLSVFDRYPVPSALGAVAWQSAREDLERHLRQIGAQPVKRSFEIPALFEKAYFDMMPIDRKLRAADFPVICNYLKLTLCNVHIEIDKRIDRPALIKSLCG